MGDLPKDLTSLLVQLFPGFVAAWILYGLTAYPKPSQFERVVQALVFSFLIKALLPFEEQVLLLFGKLFVLGTWNDDAQLLASALTGVVFGLVGSYYANNDKLYKSARYLGLTKRTAFPSEWYGAFAEEPRYVVLHISGNRRITGWPRQWPSDPAAGHFMLMDAAWLTDDPAKPEIPLDGNHSILIAAKDVEFVEILKPRKEIADGTETGKSTSASSASAAGSSA